MNQLYVAFGLAGAERDPERALRAGVVPPQQRVTTARCAIGRGAISGDAGREGLARAGSALLFFDGRIDDRVGTARALSLDVACTDAEIALAAVARWGLASPERLHGDFAWVWIDAEHRRLIAARDAFGIRPLYFAQVGAELRLSSEPGPLFADEGLRPRPDRRSLAELIQYQFVEGERTLYEGVHSLPGGCVLRCDLEAPARVTRFYLPGQGSHRHAGTVDDFEDALTQALDDRSEREAAIGVQLSGGLDSSVLTGVLAPSRQRQGLPGLRAYHLAPSGLRSDESAFAAAVAEHVGARMTVVEGRRAYAVEDPSPIELPDVWAPTFAEIYRAGLRDDVRVMITGEGSDELQQTLGREVDDAWVRGRPDEAWRFACPDRPGAPGRLLRGLARALYPQTLLHARWRRGFRGTLAPWLAPFGVRAALEAFDRAEEVRRSFVGETPTRQRLLQLLTHSSSMTFLFAEQQRLARAYGIDLVHPFLDRRVADAVLALPERVRTAEPPLNKPALRRIAERWLPARITERVTKVDYTDFQIEAWRERADDWRQLLARSGRLADLGVVEGTAFRAIDPFEPRGFGFEARIALKLERWLGRFA